MDLFIYFNHKENSPDKSILSIIVRSFGCKKWGGEGPYISETMMRICLCSTEKNIHGLVQWGHNVRYSLCSLSLFSRVASSLASVCQSVITCLATHLDLIPTGKTELGRFGTPEMTRRISQTTWTERNIVSLRKFQVQMPRGRMDNKQVKTGNICSY